MSPATRTGSALGAAVPVGRSSGLAGVRADTVSPNRQANRHHHRQSNQHPDHRRCNDNPADRRHVSLQCLSHEPGHYWLGGWR